MAERRLAGTHHALNGLQRLMRHERSVYVKFELVATVQHSQKDVAK